MYLVFLHHTVNDKDMKITFLAKGITEVKTKFSDKQSLDQQVERFRVDMLAKHELLFTKTPHLIQITLTKTNN